jgi:hypothetical protein
VSREPDRTVPQTLHLRQEALKRLGIELRVMTGERPLRRFEIGGRE